MAIECSRPIAAKDESKEKLASTNILVNNVSPGLPPHSSFLLEYGSFPANDGPLFSYNAGLDCVDMSRPGAHEKIMVGEVGWNLQQEGVLRHELLWLPLRSP